MYLYDKKEALYTWLYYLAFAVCSFIGVVAFEIEDIVTVIFFFFFLTIIATRCTHVVCYKRKHSTENFIRSIQEPSYESSDGPIMKIYIGARLIIILVALVITFVGTFILFVRNDIYNNAWACALCIFWPGAIVINAVMYAVNVLYGTLYQCIPYIFIYGLSIPFAVSIPFGFLRMTQLVQDNIFIRILLAVVYYTTLFAVSYFAPRLEFLDDMFGDRTNVPSGDYRPFSMNNSYDSSGGTSNGFNGWSSPEPIGEDNDYDGFDSDISDDEEDESNIDNKAVFDDVEMAVYNWAKKAGGYDFPVRDQAFVHWYSARGSLLYDCWLNLSETEANIKIRGNVDIIFDTIDGIEYGQKVADEIAEDLLDSLSYVVEEAINDSSYETDVEYNLSLSQITYNIQLK